MSKRKSIAGVARRARAEDKKFRTSDGFQNWVARLGWGADNQMSASTYTYDFLTRNRQQLEAMYRTAWLVGMAVDVPAEDMTRAGIEFEGTLDPDSISRLDASLRDLQIWQRTCETVRWARLFGGCIAVLLIDGQDVSTPLNLDAIGPGAFKGLLVLDRWLIQPSFNNLVTELGPNLGMPKFYEVVGDAMALSAMRIHYTRCIRMEGPPLPYYQRLAENGWGMSVIERLHDRLVAFDSGTAGVSQLLFKAHLRTIKIPQLRDLIGAGGKALEALAEQLKMIRYSQSNEGLTVLDSEDEFQADAYSFAGISDVLLQLGMQISGALQIPLIRLFGQSPTGLNSSGESDLRTYYDNINKTQETMLRQPLTLILDVLARSLGIELPKGFTFKFASLWQLTETEKAEIASKDSASIGEAFDKNIISQATAMKELRQASRISGRFSNIDDLDIAAAEQLPPSADEVAAMNAPPPNDEEDKNDGDEKAKPV